jgi:hypothetical protein
MGQQQLLLIVLGVIIVGIAVVVGINLFNANAEESAKDTIVSEATNLGAMAQQYYKKPTALGGGGNTFTGFGASSGNPHQFIPVNLLTTTSATYTVTPSDQTCQITADPIVQEYTWTVTFYVTPTGITASVSQ